MQDLSIVDVSALARPGTRDETGVLRNLDAALTTIGFVNIVGHGIDAAVIQRLRREVEYLFRYPDADKQRLRITRDNYRGYIPLGFFSPNSGQGRADAYEGYKLHGEFEAGDPVCSECSLYGPNRWPTDGGRLRRAVSEYWSACDRLLSALLRAVATILTIDASVLLQSFDKPLTNMTLLHYPAVAGSEPATGIHAHKDTDVLTVLAHDNVGGLLVKRRDADGWISAKTPPDGLLVNVGDMLELWSGGYLRSTPHKVVIEPGRERFSFPYFAVPRYDVVVEPLRTPVAGFRRDAVHVGAVSAEVWRTNWPDAAPADAGMDLGTLPD